jgi:hypothetical protein
MRLSEMWGRLTGRLVRKHRDVKSFEHELKAAGGIAGRADGGTQTVPTEKIVGSVSRWQNLRSDFFYKTGQAMTRRFERVGQAMREGKVLPPLELYKMRPRRRVGDEERAVTEYYVVDGHHRVAMARRLGQDYLDAHVVEYKVTGPSTAADTAGPAEAVPPEQSPDAPAAPPANNRPA